MKPDDDHARDWLEARDIIARFLKDLMPYMTREQREHSAAAIIARLASANPPLLLTRDGEL